MNGEILLAEDVPSSFVDVVREAFTTRPGPVFALALSGGDTARRCYEQLAAALPAPWWTDIELFWGDERCVPLDDADSNHALAREALGPVFATVRSVHPMDCSVGADPYDSLLRSRPALDLVHLGLGPDAHTASLFPGSPALHAPAARLVVDNEDPLGTNPHRRMTLTYAGIARARSVVVTVEGAAKHEAMTRVIAGDPTAPAARIDADSLVWIVDRHALDAPSPR